MNNRLTEKLQVRYNAHYNLMKVAYYHGVSPLALQPYIFQNVQDYATYMNVKILEGGERFVFQRDAETMSFPRANGSRLHIIFIAGNSGSGDITKTMVKDRLKAFLKSVDLSDVVNQNEDVHPLDLIQGPVYKGSVTIDLNMQLIMFSEKKIDSSMHNEITNYNEMVKYPIKHFTFQELQYDPTIHATGPKIMRVLTPEEVQDLIERQIGLRGEFGIDDLGFEELQLMEENRDNPFEFAKAKKKLINLILSKLPTINSTDPWVKWRGFRIGDILYVERKVGTTPVCYRRVVKLDKEIYNEAKTNSTVKIKKNFNR